MDKCGEVPRAVEDFRAAAPPRAGSFIVTIYGDVVVPRGGTTSMSTLIDVCGAQGISEGLVRTAVSRLVAAGRLEGRRLGRRSYYRLTSEAQREFAAASELLFGEPPSGRGWIFRVGGGDLPAGYLAAGWATTSEYAVAPDRKDLPYPDGLLMAAQVVAGESAAWAWPLWGLGPIEAGYHDFLKMFDGVFAALSDGYEPRGDEALALRLRAVHEYRRVLLADPRLPHDALPTDWPGPAARQLFVQLYLALADAADRYVRQAFRNEKGSLPLETATTRTRIEALSRERIG